MLPTGQQLAGLFLSSCSTFYDARFAPAPLEVRLEDSATGLNGRVLATVAGVRRPSEGAPAQVEVGLRLENLGNVPLQLDAVCTRALAELERSLMDQGFLDRGSDGNWRLSPKAMQQLGKAALRDALQVAAKFKAEMQSIDARTDRR